MKYFFSNHRACSQLHLKNMFKKKWKKKFIVIFYIIFHDLSHLYCLSIQIWDMQTHHHRSDWATSCLPPRTRHLFKDGSPENDAPLWRVSASSSRWQTQTEWASLPGGASAAERSENTKNRRDAFSCCSLEPFQNKFLSGWLRCFQAGSFCQTELWNLERLDDGRRRKAKDGVMNEPRGPLTHPPLSSVI